MSFNSITFAVFFLVVYAGYLALSRTVRGQNLLLLAASYVFYGWWDWRFCGLLAASTVIDYGVGRAMRTAENPSRRKHLLWVSLAANLGMLGFFKYFDFFANSVRDGMLSLGLEVNPVLLQVVLPVGISFYTFQTLSYTIDIYRKKLEPTNDFIAFGLYVAFFPQLVAGPIERASHLLPQMLAKRKILLPEVHAGLYLILWGLFKKIVIADNMAPVCNMVYQNYWEHQGLSLVVATIAFALQIYCDFSAYSDIARGCGKLLGFDLMVNFRLPYFAVSPSDFWRRWHISLSTWLRDYLYIPLGGNRGGKWLTQRNLMLTMLLGGLWHGAAWNFVLWGAFHGLILAIYRVADRRPIDAPVKTPAQWAGYLMRIAIMLVLTLIGWVLFRATGVPGPDGQMLGGSMEQIVHMLTQWASFEQLDQARALGYKVAFFAAPLVVVQFAQHISRDLMVMTRLPVVLRGLWYGLLIAGIFVLGAREAVEFIYFQF